LRRPRSAADQEDFVSIVPRSCTPAKKERPAIKDRERRVLENKHTLEALEGKMTKGQAEATLGTAEIPKCGTIEIRTYTDLSSLDIV
jgi:hypothetical protein